MKELKTKPRRQGSGAKGTVKWERIARIKSN